LYLTQKCFVLAFWLPYAKKFRRKVVIRVVFIIEMDFYGLPILGGRRFVIREVPSFLTKGRGLVRLILVLFFSFLEDSNDLKTCIYKKKKKKNF